MPRCARLTRRPRLCVGVGHRFGGWGIGFTVQSVRSQQAAYQLAEHHVRRGTWVVQLQVRGAAEDPCTSVVLKQALRRRQQ